MNIKTKLLLTFVLTTLLPILLIATISFQKSKNALEKNRIKALETIADLKVEKIEAFFKERKNNIKTAQDDYDIKTHLPTLSVFAHERKRPEYLSAKANLDNELKTFEQAYGYLDIMLVDLEGEIVYVTNDSHFQKDVGKPLPDSGDKAFKAGQDGIYFSDLFMNDREHNIPSMLITAPIHNFGDALIGVIALEIDMAPIYQFIQDPSGLGTTGETFIAQKMGNSVRFLNPLRHDKTTALKKMVDIGDKMALPIQMAAQGQAGSGRSNDYRNEEIIAVWRYIPSLDWGLVAKIDTQEAFQSVAALKVFLLTLGSFILLVVAMISSVFASSITRPIQALKYGMDFVSQGNLDYRVKLDSNDEIASLARHFNEMTAEMKSRNKDLKDLKYAIDAASLVAITDQKGIIKYVNDKFCETSKYSREELIGQDHRIINSGSHSAAYIKNLWTTIANGKIWRGQFKNKAKDGSIYWVESMIVPFLNEQGKPYQYLAIRTNITKQKYIEEEIKRLVQYDNLTGLPNRTLFNERLNQALKQRRWGKKLFAVMFLDLDRFKFINDTLGHAAGDQLLQEVSKRLTGCLREEDTVARMGGDEFTILLPAIAKKEDALLVAEKMVAGLKSSFTITDQELFVTGSIGVSLYPENGEDAEALIKNADAAMYRAKESGRGRFTAYVPGGLQMREQQNLHLDSALHHALERDELRLHYQPLIDLQNGKILGMEALIRWGHPETGLVSPEEFIPLAEKSGLILPIGAWVLETAVRQLKTWERTGFTDISVSINVSALQFQQPDFVEQVNRIIKTTDIARNAVKLEITESLLMKNQEKVITKLRQLKESGVRFVIDDFGTGFSSLSYLKQFPVESLKIDRSFIMNLPENPDDIVIAETIITLGHHLGLNVVAEGIETREQLAFLQARDCDIGQGYLFSRPLPAGPFTELLEKSLNKNGKLEVDFLLQASH